MTLEEREKRLSQMVHIAIGAGSACWCNIELAGTFDDMGACKIASELIATIVELFSEPCCTTTPERR